MQTAYNRYRMIQAQTAPAAELTLLLYRGAIRFLNLAAAALDRREIERAHENLLRTQAILEELDASLDLSVGAIASDLSRIYRYMLRRLVAANIAKDRGPVDEVLGYMRELLGGWEDAFAGRTNSTAGREGDRDARRA